MAIDEPLENVEIVAALGDDHRRRGLAVVPVAAHERVGHVRIHDRLLVLDVDKFTDESQFQCALESPEIG